MKIALVCGSTRPGNYTSKALNLVRGSLQDEGIEVEWIDPAKWPLGFPGFVDEARKIETLRNLIISADGIILSTPEYHGTMSSVIKLFIENMGFPSALKHKPIGLLGVAAGRIGAIKSIEALASVCLHVGGLVLPGPVSVANVKEVFDEEGNCLDPGLEKFIKGLGHNLVAFIRDHICPKYELEAIVRERELSGKN